MADRDGFREELRGVTNEDVACEVAAIASEVEATGGTPATVSVLREAARRLRASPQGETIEGWATARDTRNASGISVFIRGDLRPSSTSVRATLILHPKGVEE